MLDGLSDEQYLRLQQLVQSDDRDGVNDLLARCQQQQYDALFQDVGRLTRSLYDAINSLHTEVQGQSRVEEASDSLSYVIKATQTAAENVLDAVDDAQPYATQLQRRAETLAADWEKLGKRQLSVDEFKALYAQVGNFLSETVDDATVLNERLQAIVLAQDFQDLTGQVLHRVITMIREVEQGLVGLVSHAASVDHALGHDAPEKVDKDLSKGVGPQVNAKANDAMASQDDVDDLLSSLGF